MNKGSAEQITEWICWEVAYVGGPRFLSPSLYRLMLHLNTGRNTDWDVDVTLAAMSKGPERQRRLSSLRAEFHAACCTHLTPEEQKRLLAEVLTGAYDELGPRLTVF